MSRSVWKGPFVDPSLIKKVEKLKNQTKLCKNQQKEEDLLFNLSQIY